MPFNMAFFIGVEVPLIKCNSFVTSRCYITVKQIAMLKILLGGTLNEKAFMVNFCGIIDFLIGCM